MYKWHTGKSFSGYCIFSTGLKGFQPNGFSVCTALEITIALAVNCTFTFISNVAMKMELSLLLKRQTLFSSAFETDCPIWRDSFIRKHSLTHTHTHHACILETRRKKTTLNEFIILVFANNDTEKCSPYKNRGGGGGE